MKTSQNNWFYNRDLKWLLPAQKPEASPLEASCRVSHTPLQILVKEQLNKCHFFNSASLLLRPWNL
jgi:hypothetical protein